MRILSEVEAFKNSTQAEEVIIDTSVASIVELEVAGGQDCKIGCLAQVSFEGEYYPIVAVDDKEFKIVITITAEGLYKVDVSGYRHLKITKEVTNEAVTCKALVVTE